MARRYKKELRGRRRLSIERLEERVLLSANVWGWGEIAGSASGGGVSDDFDGSNRPVSVLAQFNETLEPVSDALFPDGVLYVAWEDETGGGGDIAWRTWDGEAYSETNYMSDLLGGGSVLFSDPQLVQSAENDVYMAFEGFDQATGLWDVYLYQLKGPDGNLEFFGTTEDGNPILGGLNLSTPTKISTFDNDTSNARHPGLGADKDGNVYVVWEDDFLGYSDIFGFFGLYQAYETNNTIVWHDLQSDTNVEESVAIDAGNLNGDSLDDLVIANMGTSDISVSLGTAGGFETTVDYDVGIVPTNVFVTDIDADNDDDVIVINSNTGELTTLISDGEGALGAASDPINVGSAPADVVVATVNDDDTEDLVIALAGAAQIAIYNGGDDGFTFGTTHTVAANPVSLEVADFNGDSLDDIVVVSASGAITFFYAGGNAQGNPTGTLVPSAPIALSTGLSDVAVVDIDFDGDSDVVWTNALDGTAGILQNAPGLLEPIWTDVGIFAAGLGLATDIEPTNLNGDAFTDLVIFGDDVYTYFGNGAGGFSVGQTLANLGTNPVDITTGNFGGFGLGLDDLAVLNSETPISSTNVFINSGGTFFDGAPDYTVFSGDDPLPGLAGPQFMFTGAYNPEVVALGAGDIQVIWQDVPFQIGLQGELDRTNMMISDLWARDVAEGGDDQAFSWTTWTTDLDADATLLTEDHIGFNPDSVSGESAAFLVYESYNAGPRVYAQSYSGGWGEVTPGSASSFGLSEVPQALEPSVAVDDEGRPVVSWAAGRSMLATDDFEIYILRTADAATGGGTGDDDDTTTSPDDITQPFLEGWEEIGFRSANYTGISDDGGDSRWPTVAVGQNDGQIYVSWQYDPPGGGDNEVFMKTRSQISDYIFFSETVNGVKITLYAVDVEADALADLNIHVATSRAEFIDPDQFDDDDGDDDTDQTQEDATDILILRGGRFRTISEVQIFGDIPGLGMVFENVQQIYSIRDMTIERATGNNDDDQADDDGFTGGTNVLFIASDGPVQNVTVGATLGGQGSTSGTDDNDDTTKQIAVGGQELNSELIGSGWVTPLDIDGDLLGSDLTVERLGITTSYGGSREDGTSLYVLGDLREIKVRDTVAGDMVVGDVLILTIQDALQGDLIAGDIMKFEGGAIGPFDFTRMELSGGIRYMTVDSFANGYLRAEEIGIVKSAEDWNAQIETEGGIRWMQIESGTFHPEHIQVGDDIGWIRAQGVGAIAGIYALPGRELDLRRMDIMGYYEGDLLLGGLIGFVRVEEGDARIEDIEATQLRYLQVMNGQLLGDRYDVTQRISRIDVNGGGFRLLDRIATPRVDMIRVSGGDFNVQGEINADTITRISVQDGGLLNTDDDAILIDQYSGPGGGASPTVDVRVVDVRGGDLVGDFANVGRLVRVNVTGGDMLSNVDAESIVSVAVPDGDLIGNLEASEDSISRVQAGGNFSGQLRARNRISSAQFGGSFTGSAEAQEGQLSRLTVGLGITGTIRARDIGSVAALNGSFNGEIEATGGNLNTLTIVNGDFVGDAIVNALFRVLRIRRGDLAGDISATSLHIADINGSIVDDADGQPTLNIANNVQTMNVFDGDISNVTFDVGGYWRRLDLTGGDMTNAVLIAEVLDSVNVNSRLSGGNVFGTSFIIDDYFGMLNIKGNAEDMVVSADIMRTLSTGGTLDSPFVDIGTMLTDLNVGADIIAPEVRAGELRGVNARGVILGAGPADPPTPPYFIEAETGTIRVAALNVPDSPQQVSVGFPITLDDGRVVIRIVTP